MVRDGFLHKSADVELLQKKASDQVRQQRVEVTCTVCQTLIISFFDEGKISGGSPGAERHQGWRDRFVEGRTGQEVPEIHSGDQSQARPSGQHQRGSDFSTEGEEGRKDPASLTLGQNRSGQTRTDTGCSFKIPFNKILTPLNFSTCVMVPRCSVTLFHQKLLYVYLF